MRTEEDKEGRGVRKGEYLENKEGKETEAWKKRNKGEGREEERENG